MIYYAKHNTYIAYYRNYGIPSYELNDSYQASFEKID